VSAPAAGGRSLSERLVESVLRRVEVRGDAGVRDAAARSFFDFGICARAGRGRIEAGWADGGGRLAVDAHALDRDDLHYGTTSHPGGVVWPAVVAASAGRDVQGARAVAAAAVGYEVLVELARLLGPDARRYWHTTAIAGTVGAAAAAAVAAGAEEEAVASAVGHAISVAGGSIQCLFERSDTRFFHRAHAVSTGLACAAAATGGLRSSRLGLEAPRGLLAALGGEEGDVRPDGAWAIVETGQRFWAASGFAHAAIDAARQLGPVAPGDVAGVSIFVSPAAATLAGVAAPTTDDEAWWSVQHAVAVSLTNNEEAALEARLTRDPAVLDLLGRCTLLPDRADFGASLGVRLRDGRTLACEVAFPLGHPERPLSDERRLRKWERLLGAGGPEALERCRTIEQRPFAELVAAVLRSTDEAA
jgi:2-methylcitrate dehydratase PrpD